MLYFVSNKGKYPLIYSDCVHCHSAAAAAALRRCTTLLHYPAAAAAATMMTDTQHDSSNIHVAAVTAYRLLLMYLLAVII